MRKRYLHSLSKASTFAAATLIVLGTADAASSGENGSQGKGSKRSGKSSQFQGGSGDGSGSGASVASESNVVIDRILRYINDPAAFSRILSLSPADLLELAKLSSAEIQKIASLSAEELEKFLSLSADERENYLKTGDFTSGGGDKPTNQLLQEATRVANAILVNQIWSSSFKLSSDNAYTYDELFKSGYNKELITMLAKASGSENLASVVNAFAVSKDNSVKINDNTLLSAIFDENGRNTDLLGLRKLSYISSSEKNLRYTLSQGESVLLRNITLSGNAGVVTEVDVTDTKLKEAHNTKATSRLFSVAAVENMDVSGEIKIKNSNSKAATTRNVMVIGAIGSMKIADNTKIVNEGRILAVGAGKLQGPNGVQVKGLELESQGSIVVGSGKSLNLAGAKFKLGASKQHLVMYAQNNLTVNSPKFEGFRQKADVYMEANTINLSNVDFPDGSKVKLVSKEGGTINGTTGSGIYPHFGSSEFGRVNFIKNVSYASNQINSTSTFDTYGGQIKISKSKP